MNRQSVPIEETVVFLSREFKGIGIFSCGTVGGSFLSPTSIILPQENVSESCQVIQRPVFGGDTPIRHCRLCGDFGYNCQDFSLSRNPGSRRFR